MHYTTGLFGLCTAVHAFMHGRAETTLSGSVKKHMAMNIHDQVWYGVCKTLGLIAYLNFIQKIAF